MYPKHTVLPSFLLSFPILEKDHGNSQRKNPAAAHYMGYSFFVSSKGFFKYIQPLKQDRKYHSLCLTSRGALAGIRNSSIGPPRGIDQTTYCTSLKNKYLKVYYQDFHSLNIDYKWKLHSFKITNLFISILNHIKCFNWTMVQAFP